MGYDYFEHTADIGLCVRAPDLDTLFVDAACGLFCLIVEDLNAVQPCCGLTFRLEASELEELFIDWMQELIYAFDTRRILLKQFDVHIEAGRLDGHPVGEPFDPKRHRLGTEVKAVTYHGLKLERLDDVFVGQMILDI